MPLSKSLPDLRRDLQDLLTEDLAATLSALRELLPENTDKHGQTLVLLARLKDANKERLRNTLSPDEYQRRIDTIRAECFDLLAGLEEADLEIPKGGQTASAEASAAKQGSILYRVPHRMPLKKRTICTIRVAIDEDAILEDIVLDDDVRLRPRVEVSDMMRAELLDPDGEVFSIRPLSEAEQLVREQGYTQWLFSVTPRVIGEHQLLVKVSMMEYNAQLGRYVPREVSVLETVTVVTESGVADLEQAPIKSTGDQLALGPVSTPTRGIEQASPPPPATSAPFGSAKPSTVHIPPPTPVYTPPPSWEVDSVPQARRRTASPMRAAAFFLVFLLVGSSVTWAFTPPPTRDWWLTSLRDSAEAYAGYKEKYHDDPRANTRVEKATFFKAEKTGELTDLREYQREYPQGQYRTQVLERVAGLETRALTNIRRQPGAENIQRFVQDFPESERLPELREAVSRRPDLLPVVESAYLRSIQLQPTEKKVQYYLRDFPKSERLSEVTEATKSRSELFRQVQPALEDAYLKKMEAAPTEPEVENFLKNFPAPVRREKFEQILEQQPQMKQRVIEKMERSRAVGG